MHEIINALTVWMNIHYNSYNSVINGRDQEVHTQSEALTWLGARATAVLPFAPADFASFSARVTATAT